MPTEPKLKGTTVIKFLLDENYPICLHIDLGGKEILASFFFPFGQCFFKKIFLSLVGGQLLYNAVLLSGVQQSESAGCTHTFLPSHPSPLSPLAQYQAELPML